MLRRLIALNLALPLVLSLAAPAAAQADPPACAARYTDSVIAFMAHCFVAPADTACAAAGSVTITLESGQSTDRLGSTARLSSVRTLALQAADGSAWPLARLDLPDLVQPTRRAALIVLGPATLTFAAAPGTPAGGAFSLEAPAAPLCADLPYPGLLIQAPPDSLALLQINGVPIAVNGMAAISIAPEGGLVINALTKETILAQHGTVIFAGHAATVTQTQASAPAPYAPERVAHLPIEVLPEMQPVALPGQAIPLRETVLHSGPAYERYTSTRVQAGLPVGVFGRTDAGDWVYVRAYTGELGWVPAAELQLAVPVPLPVFDQTPPPPSRPFGAVQAYIKTAVERTNLRAGPGRGYDLLATLPFRSDLALYGRNADGTWLLVETLDGLRGWINADVISIATPYRLEELPFAPEP